MKSLKIYSVIALAMTLSACNDFIDVPPTGVIDGDLAYSQPDKMVNAAYASLVQLSLQPLALRRSRI